MSDDEVLDDAAIVLSSSEDHDDGVDTLSPNQSEKRGRAANAGCGPSVLWAFFIDDPSLTSLSRRSVSIFVHALTTTRRARAPRLT